MMYDAFRSGLMWVDYNLTYAQQLMALAHNDSSGTPYKRLPTPRKHVDIHAYVMPHFPGNTASSWKRQLFGASHRLRLPRVFVL